MIARSARSGTISGLHVVTDPRVPRGRLLGAVAAAADAGACAIHVRDASLTARDLFELTESIRGVVRGRARLLVNDRLDVALAAGADGVQLPSRGIPPRAARSVAGGSFLIGVSTHAVEEARRAEADGADFALFGSVFPTASHPGSAGQGIEQVAAVARAVRIPVIAIGGITAERVGAVMHAGAAGVAVISAIFGADDPRVATAALTAALDEAVRGHERSHARW